MAFLRSLKPSCKSLPLGLWERRGVRPLRLQRSHPCNSKGSFQNLVVLQDGRGHKAGRTVADTAKLDSCGHNGIVGPSPRRGPSAESVQVEPWVVQFANVASFSLKAAEYLQGAETSVKVQLVAEHHLQKQALSSKQRRLWDWHGEAAAGTGRGGTSGGTAVLVRRRVDHRPGAVFQSQDPGLFAPQAVGFGVVWLVLESRQSESCFSQR